MNLKYNHSEERDDLSKPNLLPYGITPSAPTIHIPDVDLFKKNKSQTVRNHFQTRFEEIKKLYEEFVMEVQLNDLIYKARYSFVPVVGQEYHLYRVIDDDYILSLIEPERWDKYEYIGTYRMSSTDVWETVDRKEV
jgi:hypothetical protein